MEKQSKKVLYSVATTYQLLEAIVHKCLYNDESYSIITVSHWIRDKYQWYMQLDRLFNQVVVFNPNYTYEDVVNGNLKNENDKLLNAHNVYLSELHEIHVFGAEHAFGAYIELEGVPYYYWEEGAGAISKKDGMLKIFIKAHGEEKAKFQYEHHLADGEGEYVQGIFYDKYYQEKEVAGEKLLHFDLSEELVKLSDIKRNEIIDLFYKQKKYSVHPKTALVLTEHLADLYIMSWEEQVYSYKYMVDYFLQGYRLLFKPHPDDNMYYEFLFQDCEVIRTKFPAELLPFIFDERPELVATSSSTSIYGLRKQFDKVVEFNFEYSHEKQFYQLNRYYAALSVLDNYMKQGYQLHLIGVNPVIVDNFQNRCELCVGNYRTFKDLEELFKERGKIAGKSVMIVDKLENSHTNAAKLCDFLKDLSEETIVLFINSQNDYIFYDYDYKNLWNYMQPVEVKVTVRDGIDNKVNFAGPHLNEDKKEYIYVYHRGGKIPVYELEKELPNVGVTVKAKDFEGDKMQVKLLQGMLEATEKRLLYYIEHTKELEEQLKKEQKGMGLK